MMNRLLRVLKYGVQRPIFATRATALSMNVSMCLVGGVAFVAYSGIANDAIHCSTESPPILEACNELDQLHEFPQRYPGAAMVAYKKVSMVMQFVYPS